MKEFTRTARTPSFVWTAILMMLMGLAACGDGSMDPEVTACTVDTGSVAASVDVSAGPVFTWDPDCAVSWLLVEHFASGAGGDVWFVESSVGDVAGGAAPVPTNLISPPITYGTTSLPTGVQTTYGPEPLERGTSYRFVLFRVVDPSITTCPDLIQNMCRLVIHQFTW